MTIRLTIRYRANAIKANVMGTDTLEMLKIQIQQMTGVSVECQVLLFNDRVLNDNNKELKELGVNTDCVLYLKKRMEMQGGGKKEDFSTSMMKNPLVKNFMKNPDAMKSIIEMFPGLKDEIDSNPEIRMMMNSSSLQEELEMLSMNPEYMNTQLKNLDITMSKLENIPGGINMISSMIKDVQDPLSASLKDGIIGGCKVREGRKIDRPIHEAIPGGGGMKEESQLVKYREKLAELKQMGFRDTRKNLDALIACNGDLEGTIMHLGREDGKAS